MKKREREDRTKIKIKDGNTASVEQSVGLQIPRRGNSVKNQTRPVACYDGHLGPRLRAQDERKSQNKFWKALGAGGLESPKQSREQVKIDYVSTTWSLSRLCYSTYGLRPRTMLSNIFSTLGPRAQMTPCCEQEVSQNKECKCKQFLSSDGLQPGLE